MKKVLLYVMVVLYVGAGINHFISTKQYLTIMPPWLPWHRALVFISGVLEILFGLLLLFSSIRRAAALFIILLLIAVYPANIQMAVSFYKESNPYLWLALLRLPLQFVLIYWTYLYTKKERLTQ